VPGDNGIFDVRVDGRRIFSKHETGRFPDPEEILRELA
jgi:selT/selW/selH-like putative selenoprotein